MSNIKKVSGIISVLLMMVVFASCSSADYSAVVKTGSPYDYPDITWEQALDNVCDNVEWESFDGDDGRQIAECNCSVNGSNLCIQFAVSDETFEVVYMDLDGEKLDSDECSAMVHTFFGEYED